MHEIHLRLLNGDDGISDMEGKATRVGASEWSRRAARDIDGKTERSNGAFGKSDIEGKTARVAVSELGKERVSNGREHMSQPGKRTSFNSSIAMRRQTDKAKEIMRPARLLYIKRQISDLII